MKNGGIFHIVSELWRANISLYKNVVVANIFLYKNTYSALSLAVANDQSVYTQSVCNECLYADFDASCGDGDIWK